MSLPIGSHSLGDVPVSADSVPVDPFKGIPDLHKEELTFEEVPYVRCNEGNQGVIGRRLIAFALRDRMSNRQCVPQYRKIG